ncbi:M48 family metallopeptidase [Yoonia sp. 2307UL14-13]|uniref:M48 family metallopeptidase n=1 Tax=Yoonia sp. 2307UL14-13 TaxID=3126506 RepID=UPI0030AF77C7
MGCHRLEGNPPIDVTMRRSARARRLSLRVSRLDGRVTLTIPSFSPEREGISFLRSRETWLRQHLAEVGPAAAVAPGMTIPFRGRDLPVQTLRNGRAQISADAILIRSGAAAGVQVKALFKMAARDTLASASDRYAASLGRTYTRLTLRDTRSRWGSCTQAGALMFSWRLIMAPPAVLDYVAAHEVAHLVEMNHSAAFWSVVAGLMPDHETHRHWLRVYGDTLHRIAFDD